VVSRYSIIQYVPNPVADERINIGVLAFDDDIVRVRFLSKWERVRCFNVNEDISSLKEFSLRMQKAAQQGLLFPGDQSNGVPKHEKLVEVSRGWMNSIQFTEPRGSLEDVDILLNDIAQTCLLEPVAKKTRLRDRQAAAQVATSQIRRVLQQRYGDDKARELLRMDYPLQGGHMSHKFDVTVANGRPFFSAHGISFEVQTQEQTVSSLAFMIIDIKESKPEFPLAVIALPPKQESPDRDRLEKVYEQTKITYEQLGAKVLQEEQLESWAADCLENVKV
jgi:hypothetical protein